MELAWSWCRSTWRQSWHLTMLVCVMCGLLGSVSLGAAAAARRTDSAYGRYLQWARASDVLVDVPGPLLPVVHAIERYPGADSSASWLGLNAQPVVDGKIDDSFLTDGIRGSLDAEYFGQDKLTVLAGRLPSLASTSKIVLTQPLATSLKAHLGGMLTWQFYRQRFNRNGIPIGAAPVLAGRSTFQVAAIVDVPPALSDVYDQASAAILTPAA